MTTKTLQQIKDEVAKEYGYKHFNEMCDYEEFIEDYFEEIVKPYVSQEVEIARQEEKEKLKKRLEDERTLNKVYESRGAKRGFRDGYKKGLTEGYINGHNEAWPKAFRAGEVEGLKQSGYLNEEK